jgi:hypothetical protein
MMSILLFFPPPPPAPEAARAGRAIGGGVGASSGSPPASALISSNASASAGSLAGTISAAPHLHLTFFPASAGFHAKLRPQDSHVKLLIVASLWCSPIIKTVAAQSIVRLVCIINP